MSKKASNLEKEYIKYKNFKLFCNSIKNRDNYLKNIEKYNKIKQNNKEGKNKWTHYKK